MNPLNRQQSDFVEDQVQENLALKLHISLEVETNVDEESRLMRSIDEYVDEKKHSKNVFLPHIGWPHNTEEGKHHSAGLG